MRLSILGWTFFAMTCSGMAVAASSHASPTKTGAESASAALFDEARRLMARGKAAEACPKFEESLRLSPGIGILYNLADCYEKTGRTASAWTNFREVVARTAGTGQKERAAAARLRVRALEPNLSRLAINVPTPVSGLTVTRDGVSATDALWGTPVPVDPGEHLVKASAAGFTAWEMTVVVGGRGAISTVSIPKLVQVTPAVASPSVNPLPDDTAIAAKIPPAATERPVPPPSSAGWKVPAGIAGVTVGGLGLGAGVAIGLAARSKAQGAACDAQNVCTAEGVQQRSQARSLGNVGTAVALGGAAVAAAGTVLWVTARPSSTKGGVTTWFGVTPGGIYAFGDF